MSRTNRDMGTYCFFYHSELFELLSQRCLLGVPREAASAGALVSVFLVALLGACGVAVGQSCWPGLAGLEELELLVEGGGLLTQ